jgi:hypothetical protein
LKEIHAEGRVVDVISEFTKLSGLQQLQAIFAGETGCSGIVKTLDLHPVSAEEGCVVFVGSPTQALYNPLGSVHGRLRRDLSYPLAGPQLEDSTYEQSESLGWQMRRRAICNRKRCLQ